MRSFDRPLGEVLQLHDFDLRAEAARSEQLLAVSEIVAVLSRGGCEDLCLSLDLLDHTRQVLWLAELKTPT